MNTNFTRRAALLITLFTVGFIAGQLTFSIDMEAKAKARRATLIEGTVHTDDNLRQLEQLRELGYVDGTVDSQPGIRGVELHDPARAFPGLNFYSSRIRTSAQLIDMNGEQVHGWNYPGGDGWEHAELLPNGDILVVANEASVFKLDMNSNLLWQRDLRAHHDLAVRSNGDIYVLVNEKRKDPEIHLEVPIIEDSIQILSGDGQLKDRFSILKALRSSPYGFLLASPTDLPANQLEGERLHLDMLHTNHIQVFDGSLKDRSPLFSEGNLLISMRTINTIAIIDGVSRAVIWAWGPTNLYRQHHPTLLESGSIVLFDNGRHHSQIIEMDPLTLKIRWRYSPPRGFLSRFRGSVQRLPNGNSLITESDKGYVFEITPEKETVWRFANPDIDEKNLRIAIWRMTRYGREELPFLEEVTPSSHHATAGAATNAN
ncbi:MAG: arylsulfotransferase family protein [Acidobacteriota bacterium]